jgi:hypothetical protein
VHFWGKNCADELVRYLDTIKTPMLIYAHNGGKFDFHYLFKYIQNPVKIINSRLVSAKIGAHELRDSYAILPIPLAVYEKDSIDYKLFEKDKREKHRDKIVDYLRGDCVYLFDLVNKFNERFGQALTIGGAAIKKLIEFHPFETANSRHDEKFRQFYFGGRVQCFQSGIINKPLKIYDVNSMYPAVMRNCVHPTGKKYLSVKNAAIDKRGNIVGIASAQFYFALIEAEFDAGYLPVRTKTGLDFTQKSGVFFTTSHELKVLFKHKVVKKCRVIEAHAPIDVISFADYVDTFSAEKIAAKKSGDKAAEIFAKLLLNSAYGKTAQNPAHYKDWLITNNDVPKDSAYKPEKNFGDYQFWAKPSIRQSYYDVAIGASITSAARAVLLDALFGAIDCAYCDTDSIICSELTGAEISDTKLGAWKLEAKGERLSIGGKKMYALYDKDGVVIKKASKGAHLTGAQIDTVAAGGEADWQNEAPTFSLKKEPSFLTRKIKKRI